MTDEVRWQVVIELPDGSTAVVAREVTARVNGSLSIYESLKAEPRKSRVGKMLLDDVVQWAEVHQREYPRHGVNCACADAVIHRVRKALTLPDTTEFQAPLAQQRIDWIMSTATRRY